MGASSQTGRRSSRPAALPSNSGRAPKARGPDVVRRGGAPQCARAPYRHDSLVIWRFVNPAESRSPESKGAGRRSVRPPPRSPAGRGTSWGGRPPARSARARRRAARPGLAWRQRLLAGGGDQQPGALIQAGRGSDAGVHFAGHRGRIGGGGSLPGKPFKSHLDKVSKVQMLPE